MAIVSQARQDEEKGDGLSRTNKWEALQARCLQVFKESKGYAQAVSLIKNMMFLQRDNPVWEREMEMEKMRGRTGEDIDMEDNEGVELIKGMAEAIGYVEESIQREIDT